jgi:hypothetical protein
MDWWNLKPDGFSVFFFISEGLGTVWWELWLWDSLTMAQFQNKGGEFLPWTDHSQVVPSFPIFILSFTNFPKENNAEYNGNRKNE